MTIAIFLLTFVAVFLGVTYVLEPRQDLVRRRILEGSTEERVEPEVPAYGGPWRRLVRPVLDGLGRTVAQVLPTNLVATLERLLIQAGQPMSLLNFVTLWSVTAAGSIVLAALLIVRSGGQSAVLLLVCATVFLGVASPFVLLRRRAARRRRQIERALPDTIDLLLTSVEAGLGVDAAFALVTERSSGPLAMAFNEYLKQVGLGRSRRDALADIAERTGSVGLQRLSGTVAQTWDIGASIGDVLRIQASELRGERRRKAQEAAQRAPFWMTIPMVLCFLPAMAAVAVVPAVIRLVNYVNSGFNG